MAILKQVGLVDPSFETKTLWEGNNVVSLQEEMADGMFR